MKKIICAFVMMLFVTTAFTQQIYNVRVSTMADGIFEQYYGAVKVSGDVMNGMKEGSWVENHPNSDIPHFIIQYKEDKKDGLYLEFYKQANLIKKIEYKNDSMHGGNYAWDKNGRATTKQEYKEGINPLPVP